MVIVVEYVFVNYWFDDRLNVGVTEQGPDGIQNVPDSTNETEDAEHVFKVWW